MSKQKQNQLRVFISAQVRSDLQDILAEQEEKELGIIFTDDPADCDTEIMAEESIEQIRAAIQAKRVPILPGEKIIQDFDPVAERGGAFVYKLGSKYSLLDALIRARENHKFPYDWKNILRAGQKSLANK